MNKHLNFEDNIFILNAGIRLIRDMLKLEPDPGIFLHKTLEDLEFTGNALESLLGNLLANPRLLDRDTQFDNLSDTEWQFSQLLTAFAGGKTPFSAAGSPEAGSRISRLREESAARRKLIDKTAAPPEQGQAEPVVSQAELSGLLKGV